MSAARAIHVTSVICSVRPGVKQVRKGAKGVIISVPYSGDVRCERPRAPVLASCHCSSRLSEVADQHVAGFGPYLWDRMVLF